MNATLISVILPVYNVEQYLSKCLDSIINQTYRNLEIICINDGSSDNSQNILEEYAQKDERIKIINQKNQGISTARNKGLNIAVGEYVYFIDSDDEIDKTLLEKAINLITKNDADIVIFDAINVYKNTKIPVRRLDKFLKHNHLYNFYFNEQKDILYHTPTAWSKLYKKSFLDKNDLKFPPELTVGEDCPFWISSLFCNPKITILNECLYYYFKRNSGLSRTFTSEFLEKQWNVYQYIKNSKQYSNYSDEQKMLILDFECRLTVYGYSTIRSLKLFLPYEKSLNKFSKEYKLFKKYNLWQLRGYRLLCFRYVYTVGKFLYLWWKNKF